MTAVTGGCQCGAVRYRIEGGVGGSHFCHCRMCQKATGGLFAALVGAPKSQVTWDSPPDVFESSSVAERPFCARCGTPLGFTYKQSDWMNVTIGSLDDPSAAPIETHWGVESMAPWLKLCDAHPRRVTGEGLDAVQVAGLRGMTSNQRGGA